MSILEATATSRIGRSSGSEFTQVKCPQTSGGASTGSSRIVRNRVAKPPGMSGVLISRFPCSLDTSSISSYSSQGSHLHRMSQVGDTPNSRTVSDHQQGANHGSPSTNELCIKLVEEFTNGRIHLRTLYYYNTGWLWPKSLF